MHLPSRADSFLSTQKILILRFEKILCSYISRSLTPLLNWKKMAEARKKKPIFKLKKNWYQLLALHSIVHLKFGSNSIGGTDREVKLCLDWYGG